LIAFTVVLEQLKVKVEVEFGKAFEVAVAVAVGGEVGELVKSMELVRSTDRF
jgi:hypothetical protein